MCLSGSQGNQELQQCPSYAEAGTRLLQLVPHRCFMVAVEPRTPHTLRKYTTTSYSKLDTDRGLFILPHLWMPLSVMQFTSNINFCVHH